MGTQYFENELIFFTSDDSLIWKILSGMGNQIFTIIATQVESLSGTFSCGAIIIDSIMFPYFLFVVLPSIYFLFLTFLSRVTYFLIRKKYDF
jgi:hypothetical protein